MYVLEGEEALWSLAYYSWYILNSIPDSVIIDCKATRECLSIASDDNNASNMVME